MTTMVAQRGNADAMDLTEDEEKVDATGENAVAKPRSTSPRNNGYTGPIGVGIFEVIRQKGLRVRYTKSRKSDVMCTLDYGTRLHVVRVEGGRMNVGLPVLGWCSATVSGEKAVRQLSNDELPRVCKGRFECHATLGKGSFCVVFSGKDLKPSKGQNRTVVAIKIDCPKKERRSQFKREVTFLDHLSKSDAIPRTLWKGKLDAVIGMPGITSTASCIVMEQQGPSLSSLLDYCGGSFSIKTILLIAHDIIKRMEDIHDHGITHRDMKPANFIMGRSDPTRVYVIDFGLATFWERESGNHVPMKTGLKPCGTVRYASVNTHNGLMQSRRDDLEALGYVLIYLAKGSLPWQKKSTDPRTKNMDKWKRILIGKEQQSVEQLCKNLPTEMQQYLNYCKSLAFDQRPDYNKLRNLFEKAFKRGMYEDKRWDWTP